MRAPYTVDLGTRMRTLANVKMDVFSSYLIDLCSASNQGNFRLSSALKGYEFRDLSGSWLDKFLPIFRCLSENGGRCIRGPNMINILPYASIRACLTQLSNKQPAEGLCSYALLQRSWLVLICFDLYCVRKPWHFEQVHLAVGLCTSRIRYCVRPLVLPWPAVSWK